MTKQQQPRQITKAHYILTITQESVTSAPILQMKELRSREVEELAQGLSALKQQNPEALKGRWSQLTLAEFPSLLSPPRGPFPPGGWIWVL